MDTPAPTAPLIEYLRRRRWQPQPQQPGSQAAVSPQMASSDIICTKLDASQDHQNDYNYQKESQPSSRIVTPTGAMGPPRQSANQ